ncbi:MAG: 50S ribosomal protein L21 [Firmicutes bacterium]|nr:50S ribosomal protein L21 [Bacillota bacterium]
MYAIIKTGGKQYQIAEGDVINVEKLNAQVGETVAINEVLAVGTEDGVKIGKPVVEGASVVCEVLEQGKAKKVVIYKYKAKKDSHKKRGHRQPYTQLQIKSIEVK